MGLLTRVKLYIHLSDTVIGRQSLLRNRGTPAAGARLMSGSAVAETDSLQSGMYPAILGDGTLRYRKFGEPDRPNCVNAAVRCNRKTGGLVVSTAR